MSDNNNNNKEKRPSLEDLIKETRENKPETNILRASTSKIYSLSRKGIKPIQ
jgi:hypothetical protein